MIHRLTTFVCLLFSLAPAFAADAPSGPPGGKTKAPPCWPKQIGSTGLDFKAGETDTTRWAAWSCVVKGQKIVYGIVGLKSFAGSYPNAQGLTTIKTAQAYLLSNAGDPNNPALIPGWEAIRQAYAVKQP